MSLSTSGRLLYIVVLSIVNIIIAYHSGSHGYDSFYITAVALGLLCTWLSIQLLGRLYRSDTLNVFKIFGTLPLLFLWLFGVGMTLTSTLRGPQVAEFHLPPLNGWLIVLGVIPYLIPRIGLYGRESNAGKIGVGLVATFVSILVLYMAYLGYTGSLSPYHLKLLVITTQLQLIMNYIIVRTDFLVVTRLYIIKQCMRYGYTDETSQSALIVVICGLPFLIPIIVTFMISL